MKLEFESIEEVKEFVTKLKGTRGGKADKEDEAAGVAPAPLAPPAGGQFANPPPGSTLNQPMTTGFAPSGAGATAGAAGPFAVVANGPAPEVLALVTRINTRIDGAVASGQPMEQMIAWFRGECAKAGVDANSYTMDQIKAVALPKMPVPALEGIAKLMNA